MRVPVLIKKVKTPGVNVPKFTGYLKNGKFVEVRNYAAFTLGRIVKKVGDTRLSSPQISNQQDMTAEGETALGQSPATKKAGPGPRLFAFLR